MIFFTYLGITLLAGLFANILLVAMSPDTLQFLKSLGAKEALETEIKFFLVFIAPPALWIAVLATLINTILA